MTILQLEPIVKLNDEQFYELCRLNRDLQLERTALGEIVIMPPTGGETGNRNIELAFQLQAWSRQKDSGIAFDSYTGFKLPNGAVRSPDAAWISQERWNALDAEQRKIFPPICPDFVVELLSPTDSLLLAQNKMQEYQDNGARLGWLINRQLQQVEVYQIGKALEILTAPKTLSGEPVLAGFSLNLASIW